MVLFFFYFTSQKIKNMFMLNFYLELFKIFQLEFLVSNWGKKKLFGIWNGALFRPQIKQKGNTDDSKLSDRQVWANSVDQIIRIGAVWSGSTLLAILSASVGKHYNCSIFNITINNRNFLGVRIFLYFYGR